MNRLKRPSAALSQPTSGLPQFQVSSSKVLATNMVAHPCGALASCANRSAERRNKNMPPIRPWASRASQNPFLLRPIKKSGIARLRTRASGRLGRMAGSARRRTEMRRRQVLHRSVTDVKPRALQPRNETRPARAHLCAKAGGSVQCRAATAAMPRPASHAWTGWRSLHRVLAPTFAKSPASPRLRTHEAIHRQQGRSCASPKVRCAVAESAPERI